MDSVNCKKNKPVGVKWKILRYLALFVAVIIALLWLFFIVLLDDIYSSIVMRTLKSSADELAEHAEMADIEDVAKYIASEHEICIYVFRFEGKSASALAGVHISDGCILHGMDSDDLAELYTQAKKADDGICVKRIPMYGFNTAHQEGNRTRSSSGLPDAIIYTRSFKLESGDDGVIFLNCAVSPVSATVKTLRSMLLWISVAISLLAILLAYVISRRISKPIADVNSEAKKLSGGVYDGSGIRRAYREIGELNDTLSNAAGELQKVESMRRELIANISHDLRTPLTLIEGYSEMMRDIPDENTPENMQVVIDETKRLSTLVSDLLELSRLEGGKQELRCESFDIADAVGETAERVRKLYEPEGYRIECTCDRDAIVYADRTRILQVIYNLIGNAVTYTGGDKTVSVDCRLQNGTVRVSVIDSGEGISKDELPLIWDRYYRLDRVHKRGAGGSGLGLSIVKEILLMHKARFGVTSEVGKGSTFWFELAVIK